MNPGINVFEIYLLEKFKNIRKNVFFTNMQSFQLALQVQNLMIEKAEFQSLNLEALIFKLLPSIR